MNIYIYVYICIYSIPIQSCHVFPCLKLLGGCKVDSAFHPCKVGKMSEYQGFLET